MRKIELKKIERPRAGSDACDVFSYKVQMAGLLTSVPAKGLSLGQIRDRMRVADLLDAAPEGGELLLEESDWQIVCEVINATVWAAVSRDVLDFADAFLKAPRVAAAPAT